MRNVRRQFLHAWIALGVVFVAAGCEPGSISDAREQIGRGGIRVLEYSVPIVDTMFQVQTLFDSESIVLDTTPSGVLAVRIDPESLVVAAGEQLVFEAVTLDSLVVSFVPLELQVPPGTDIAFGSGYDALSSEVRFQAVDTTVIRSGTIMLTTHNRLPVTMDYFLTLSGFIGPSGSALTAAGTVGAAPGDGSYSTDVLTIDLAGATILPALARVDFNCFATTGAAPLDTLLGDRAIIHAGVADFVVERLAGPLDPAQTPELNISVEEVLELPRSDFDFDDFEEALRDSRITTASIRLAIDNEADLPATSSDLTIGIVQVDVFGNPLRNAFGDLAYETDLGGPILVPVVNAGGGVLNLARSSTSTFDLAAGALVDRLVNLALNDARVALVAGGGVTLGDGNPGSVSRADEVGIRFDVSVPLDLTIPESGVSFTRNTTQDGLLNLSEQNADEIAERVTAAFVTTDVLNQTPFGVELEIAFVAGELGDGVDVFTQPARIILERVAVDAPAVDGAGRATEATSTVVEIELAGTEIRQLLSERFTAGVRVRLVPSTGADGRGAIGATDRILLDSRARIQLRAGGS